MSQLHSRTAPIDYGHYRAEAARLRRHAIDEAFTRLRRLFQSRGRHGARDYAALSAGGCGQ